MTRYLLAHMLESSEVGQEFSAWPLHVTQVPWFETEASLEQLTSDLLPALLGTATLSIVASEIAYYGEQHDIPVFKFGRVEELYELHEKLVAALDEKGHTIEDRRWLGPDHITDRSLTKVQVGNEFVITSLDLVEDIGEVPSKQRRIAHRFELPVWRGELTNYFDFQGTELASARDEDVESLVEIINEAFSYQDPYKTERRTDKDHLTRRIKESDFYVAWQNDEIVGCVFIKPHGEMLHLGMLTVVPELRGKGLAPAMMVAIENLARAKDYKLLELNYMSAAPWLRQYYEKYGFSQTGEVINWGRIDLFGMVKAL